MDFPLCYQILSKKTFIEIIHIQSKCWKSKREMVEQPEML